MLWHKAWLETRWRFLIGLAVMIFLAAATVFGYSEAVKLLPAASRLDIDGTIGRQIAEQIALLKNYRAFIWTTFVRDDMRQLWALLAVVLGAGGLYSQRSRGGAVFTLSMPVSRRRVLAVRAATALAELAILAMAAPLVIAALSPAVGQSYSAADALVHGVCMFIAGSTLFSLTHLLSTVFNDIWRPPLLVLCLTVLMMLVRQTAGDPTPPGLLGVMTAESYFRGDGLPVLGLIVTTTLSVGMLYAAGISIDRRDF
jgi:ABC-type transport system involved in multi-copper enzyme maturation permease subunit